MATYTEHYQLHQWEPQDPFLRTDFNQDLLKIDQTLARAQAELDQCGKIVWGSYVGTGDYGEETPTALDFADSLGTAPKMIMVAGPTPARRMFAIQGISKAYCDEAANEDFYTNYITWTETGLSWYNGSADIYQLNNAGDIYRYFAIG